MPRQFIFLVNEALVYDMDFGPDVAEGILSESYAFFWVIPRRLDYICQSFGTLCVFHLHMQLVINLYMFRATMCPSSGETTVLM